MRGPARDTGAARAVAELQRTRILTAMALSCRRTGAGRVSVSEVVAAAGVSRRTFYELFRDRDDCLAAALEEALTRAGRQALPAYEAQSDWRGRVRAGVAAFLDFLDADRAFGSLLVIDWLGGGERALRRRAEVLALIAGAIDRDGRRAARAPGELARSTAEGVLGGVLSILHARLLAEPDKPVRPLAGELTGMIVLPYLGASAAAREAARRPARTRPLPAAPASEAELLAELQLRLTDRTLLVLRALAEHGGETGMSNRQLGQAAGVADQGQISKLLSRLAAHGLIVNERGRFRVTGEPNAWRLTPKGARLERATRRS